LSKVISEATDVVKVLKEKLREFNINPEAISIYRVEKVDDKWVIEFRYFFTMYVVEVDEQGRVLSFKAKSGKAVLGI